MVIGFGYCEPNKDKALDAAGELQAAYVLPEYRGGVTGPLIISTMARYLISQNITTMGCWAFDQNKIQRWYRMLGFVRSVRRDRIIEDIAIPESGFVYPDPLKLIKKLQPFIDAHYAEIENRQYYPFHRHSHFAELNM